MGYVKNTWVNQDVERPKTYEVTTNQDGSITLTDSFGLVTELGTPVNATNMNHIEDGLALSDLMKYSATVTYNTGEWVTGVVNNEKGIYASLVDNNTGNALSDTTKWEDVTKRYLSNKQIANCVLEAPNGMATYSGNIITVKGGLKVLIPNGRNADGTLKNIEYTLPNDVSAQVPVAYSTYNRRWALFIDNTGGVHINWSKLSYFIGMLEPQLTSFPEQQAIWFDTFNNYIKYTIDNGSTWNIVNYCFLGDVEVFLNTDVINTIKLNLPIRIFTKNDDNEISSYAFPSNTLIELPALGASGTVFTAPANGYLVLAKQTNDYNQYVQFNAIDSSLGYKNNILTGQEVYNAGSIAYACMPMLKGQSTKVFYNAGGSVIEWAFVYAEGEVH